MAAVRGRPGYRPEVDVDRGWEQVDPVLPSAHVRPPVDRGEVRREHAFHHVVGVIVVVSVLRGLVHQNLAKRLGPGEVILQGCEERVHRNILVIEYVILECSEGVGHRPQPDPLDVA